MSVNLWHEAARVRACCACILHPASLSSGCSLSKLWGKKWAIFRLFSSQQCYRSSLWPPHPFPSPSAFHSAPCNPSACTLQGAFGAHIVTQPSSSPWPPMAAFHPPPCTTACSPLYPAPSAYMHPGSTVSSTPGQRRLNRQAAQWTGPNCRRQLTPGPSWQGRRAAAKSLSL